jgi:pimeloyl-ACP methyl ester carboxylesterase
MPKVSDEFSLMWNEAWRPSQSDSPFPLHIIHGMNTTSEMSAVMNILVDRSPSAHLSVIKGATHLLPILKPQKFNDVAMTWLRKIW